MKLLDCLLVLLLSTTTALTPSSSAPRRVTQQQPHSRAAFLSSAVASTGAALLLFPSLASAKSVDPKLAGTKKDPKFEACLSQCMYECTKPKGEEQKSRTECLPECKQKCAVNKEQLMLGTPLLSK